MISGENNILDDELRAVILCGGSGSRMGDITKSIPKSLVEVQNKPILWYSILKLYDVGFRRFIFPLGYKGSLIRQYIVQEFSYLQTCEFQFVETGISTTIAERLSLISSYIPNNSNFFLINGDTIFSFDISGMLKHHIEYKALLTLTSVSVISPFGLIVEENGKITDFRRESSISHMGLADGKNDGYVNGGLSWINKKAFKYIDLKNCYNFEHELFPILIKLNCVEKYALEGTWIPIDTSKDVQTLNQQHESEYNQVKSLKKLKKTLAKNNTLKETP